MAWFWTWCSKFCDSKRKRAEEVPGLLRRAYGYAGLLVQESLTKAKLIGNSVNRLGHHSVRLQFEREFTVPRFRIRLWVVERKVENERIGIGSPDALDHMQVFGVRVTDGIEPARVFETD